MHAEIVVTLDTATQQHNLFFDILFPDNGKELLSMDNVIDYLLLNSVPLVSETNLQWSNDCSDQKWQHYVSQLQGQLVTVPGLVSLQ